MTMTMAKTITITDIQWNTDGDDDILQTLPTEVVIDSPTKEMLEDLEAEGPDGYLESIEDYLSETYEYCVFGFSVEVND